MIPESIRWRLPLSYAAIALLTTLALGAVLLGTLRSYYLQQELDYLTGNAQAISRVLAPLLEAEPPPEAIKSQLSSYAFLSQTRVRLLDRNESLLADSGAPQASQEVLAFSLDIQIEADATQQTITQTISSGNSEPGYLPLIVIRKASGEAAADLLLGSEVNVDIIDRLDRKKSDEGLLLKKSIAVTGTNPAEFEAIVRREIGLVEPAGLIAPLPAIGTPYGFGFNPAQGTITRRSAQRVRQPITDLAGQVIGLVELSEGPAYGDEVLVSVAWGWGLASGVAVLLAGLVGWGISRRISLPLSVLTEVTGRMAEGDLSRRALVNGRDEVGQLAASFNEMADQVEVTVRALRRFVADATHELHTPLTALRTNLELAISQSNPTEQDHFLTQAHAQAHRLERLTTNLLDLSRLEAHSPAQDVGPVDLNQLLADGQELWASRAEQGDLHFTCALPPTPVIVRGQAGQLRQVFDNLLDNAFKFTPAGGTIDLTLRQTEEGQAELTVTDSGIGILAKDVAQLFSRFHRGRNASGYSGNGLGLAIVKTIIEQHGGHIEVEPLERGTRFLLRLPQSD